MCKKLITWLARSFGILDEYEDKINQLENDIQVLENQNNNSYDEAESFGTITFNDVRNELIKHTFNVHISDAVFNVTSMVEGKRFAEETRVDIKQYIAEDHDCDNFSFALMGYWSLGLISFPFGIAWSSTHAFNFMIDDAGQLWVIEPQTNQWFKIEDVKNNPMYYPWRMALC